MSWFEELTGSTESSPDDVRRDLYLDGQRLRSRRNGGSWHYGELETPTLGQLRQRVLDLKRPPAPVSVRSIVADARQLHADTANANALFQVASQFNLLEMVGPHVTPERGVGIYESDPTQGPACAIAAGAGTIFRNYFAPVNGRIGQTAENQIDCIAGLGTLLGNDNERLWQMKNGYALPSAAGLDEVDRTLLAMPETERDRLREALQIGLHWDTEVTLPGGSHRVSQAFCSALPVTYTGHSHSRWRRFAILVLEAAYEATVCAATLNAERTGKNTLFLTLVGGGAFGNSLEWITSGIRHALTRHPVCGLDIVIVSRRRLNLPAEKGQHHGKPHF